MTTVLFLGGGRDAVSIIQRAVDAGYGITVVDRDLQCPAAALTDRVLVADVYDATAVLTALFYDDPPDAVLCAATDAQITAARVASKYGLSGQSVDTAVTLTDKTMFNRVLSSMGVPTPITYVIHRTRVRDVFESLHSGWWVVKPATGRGAAGVSRVWVGPGSGPPVEFARATFRAWAVNEPAICQPWIEGVQLSTESIVAEGRILWTAIAERNYSRLNEFHPYVIEDGSTTPVRDHGELHQAVDTTLQRAVTVLSVKNGTVKGDLVWDGSVTWVIELAARLSGGGFCTEIIPRVWGIDVPWLAIRSALGYPLTPNDVVPTTTFAGYVCQRYRFLTKPTRHQDRGSYVLGIGRTRKTAERRAKKALRRTE